MRSSSTSIKQPRVRHAARRRGGVAAGRASAFLPCDAGLALDRKKLAAFSAAGGRFLSLPIGETSFSMPVVAGGAPRSVAGGSNLGYADAAPTPNALRPSTDESKQVSPDAQREAKRQAVNNDRSAYQQQ